LGRAERSGTMGKSKYEVAFYIALAFVAAIVIGAGLFYFWYLLPLGGDTVENWGVRGDAMAPFAALLNAGALIAALLAVWMQRIELQETRDEMIKQRTSLDRTAHAQEALLLTQYSGVIAQMDAGLAILASADLVAGPTAGSAYPEAAKAIEERRVAIGYRIHLALSEETTLRASLRSGELFKQPEYAALREASDERRHMLVCAREALALSELTTNEKARIERTLRDLDTDEVLFLHELDKFEDTSFEANPKNTTPEEKQRAWHNARQRVLRAWEKPLLKASLTVAGCISEDNGSVGGPTLVVTPIGRLVLNVLDSFIKEKRGG
jgi:hypothetical protein